MMTAAAKVAQWVEKKPMILARFDEAFSDSLLNSRQGFEHLTIVKPHSFFQDFMLPTVCLLEIKEHDGTKCYLSTVTRKAAVSTFDTRLTIKKLRQIVPTSFREIVRRVKDTRIKNLLKERLPREGSFAALTPKLSAHIITFLSQEADNNTALDVALSILPGLRRASNINWAQEDSIHTALAAFGIRGNSMPDEVILKRGATSGLGLIGSHLYEDNVVHADVSYLPGFDAIAPDVTGRAVFTKRDERLVVYTANKLPLEKMLGVDLIYINETRGNTVMVQYKMLEEVKSKNGNMDWRYRPDKQLRDEILRMQLPPFNKKHTDYRMSRNPFFFKFVKRNVVADSHQSFLVSLDHLNQILAAPESKGSKGGIRLSYEALDGTYLREADMISLIRSGYVGTHRAETKALAAIISAVAKGDNAVVLAWQSRILVDANSDISNES